MSVSLKVNIFYERYPGKSTLHWQILTLHISSNCFYGIVRILVCNKFYKEKLIFHRYEKIIRATLI